MANTSGTFAAGAGGTSSAAAVSGEFSVSIAGLDDDGKIALERSFDTGTTWKVVETFRDDVEAIGNEPATSIQYRLRVVQPNGSAVTYYLGNG